MRFGAAVPFAGRFARTTFVRFWDAEARAPALRPSHRRAGQEARVPATLRLLGARGGAGGAPWRAVRLGRSLGAAALALLLSLVYPVWVAPLFDEFTPLAETPHADLEPRIRGVAERVEVPVDRVMVVDASPQGRHGTPTSPASEGGVVALYDTLLWSRPPEEVESIFAHELGHRRRDRRLWACLFAAVGARAALFVAARVLRRAIGRPPLLLRHPSRARA